MFWTIVGALAFFFIGLPLIFGLLSQAWFWKFTGWIALILSAFIMSSYFKECERDAARERYERKIEEQRIENERKNQEQLRIAQEQRYQAEQRRKEALAEQQKLAWQRKQTAIRQEAERQREIKEYRQNNAKLVSELLATASSGKEALKSQLREHTRNELDNMRILFLHEANARYKLVHGIKEDYEYQMIQEVLRQIDVVIATTP